MTSAASGGEVKVCPFCGNAPELQQDVESHAGPSNAGYMRFYGVFCRTCMIQQFKRRDKQDAINRWNARAPSPEVAKVAEEMEAIEGAMPRTAGNTTLFVAYTQLRDWAARLRAAGGGS